MSTLHPAVVSHSDTVEIHVSHSHFMAYMSTLLNQGVLLQEHNNRLRPIALHGRHAIQQSTLIDFGIDCSGSMRDVFPRLKALLIDILQKLPKTLDINATTIRISRFGSKDTQFPLIEFPLTQLSKLIKAVRAFELGNDQTALYQFLVQEYASFKRFENFNVVFVLLSDGGDNDSDPNCVPKSGHEDQLTITLRSLENAISPPRFFSIEIGELTDAILEVIKQKTGGVRMQAGRGLESFEVFFNHVGELAITRHFLHFAQEARRFKLPVVAGKIIIADPEHYLVPGVPFQMNGVSYRAERQDLSQQTEPLFLVAEERKQKAEQEEIREQQYQAQLEQMRQEFAEAQQKQLQDFQVQLQEVRVQLQESQTLQQQQQQELEQLRNENTRLRLELQAQQHNSVALASYVALTANDSDSASQSSGASVTAVLQESLGDGMSSLSAQSATALALNQVTLTERDSSSSSADARDPASVSPPGILSAFDAQRQGPAQSVHTENSLTQKQPPKRSWWGDCSIQ